MIAIASPSLFNLKVLLEGLYDPHPDCNLNKLKRDKDGIARDYTHVLNNIWEYVTSDWQVVQMPKKIRIQKMKKIEG